MKMEIWQNLVIYDILMLIFPTKMHSLGLFDDPEPPQIVPMVPLDWASNYVGLRTKGRHYYGANHPK